MDKTEKQVHEIFGATLRINSDDLKIAHERARIFIDDLKEIEAITQRISGMPCPGAVSVRLHEEMGYGEMKRMISMAEVKVSQESIKKAVEKFHIPKKCQINVPPGEEKKTLTRFQVFQAFTDAKGFAYSIWPIVHTLKTREEFIELLNSEFTEEELQLIITAAREGRYPVSLERLQ